MTDEFKVGDKVKWVDRQNDSEMLHGTIIGIDYTSRVPIRIEHLINGLKWITATTPDALWLTTDDLAEVPRYLGGDWDVDPIVPEKKGYEPDGFDREAFDDFMRNL